MANSVRKVQYAYVMVPNRPGQGAKLLLELQAAGIDLQAYSGFPGKGGAQIDLVTRDMPGLKRVARKNGWRLSKAKKGLLCPGHGSDRRRATTARAPRRSEGQRRRRRCGVGGSGSLRDDPLGAAQGLRAGRQGARRPLSLAELVGFL